MSEITVTEFFGELDDIHHIVSDYDIDRLADLEESKCRFYKDGDVLYFKEFEEEGYTAYAWLKEDVCCEQVFKNIIEDKECTALALSACGFLPSGITKYFGGLAFKKTAQACSGTETVKLGEEDAPAILAFCDKLDKGSFFEQDEAESFRYVLEEKMFTTFGIYQGKELAGMVFYRVVPEKRLGVLSEIAVLPEYQSRGFGKRLVNSALGEYPGYDYIYTCHKRNYRSMALADSCGFEFYGVKNLWLKSPK